MKKVIAFTVALVMILVALCGCKPAVCKEGEHEYGGWTITLQPTCVAAGSRSRTCVKCGDVATESIAATGVHSYVGGRCSVCNAVEPLTWEQIINGYDSEKTMLIGAWNNPRHDYESYRIAAEMGLTHIFIDEAYTNLSPGETVGTGSRGMEELQTWFTQLGLKAIWQTWQSVGSGVINTYPANLKNYSCMDGVNLYDEPTVNVMDQLKTLAKQFDDSNGESLFGFINLWPSSGAVNIGCTYTEYIAKYKEILSQITVGKRIVSCDVYPLLKRGSDLVLDGSWLYNMYMLRQAADELGADFHMFIQSVGYNMHRQPQTEREIAFQVWTDMCFGITGYTYFTYAGDGSTDSWQYTNSIVTKSSPVSTPHNQDFYDGCKNVNEEVTNLCPVYMSFDWKGVLATNGKQSSEIDAGLFNLYEFEENYPFLKNYSSQYGAVYGIFEDEQGRDGMVITNYTDPSLAQTNGISLKFADANRVLMYRNGEWTCERIYDNTFEIMLESGEGIFIIPVKL